MGCLRRPKLKHGPDTCAHLPVSRSECSAMPLRAPFGDAQFGEWSMKLRFRSFLSAVTLPLASGCVADEMDPRGVAFPEPIGYTLPGASNGITAAPRSPQPPIASQPAFSDEVVVGDDADDDDGSGQVRTPEQDAYADEDPAALTDFRAPLDPYGSWSEDPTYGTVWVPSPDVVGDDFTPYSSAGHWAYDDDYVWVSDYDWGWVPFHYGRWAYGQGRGWEWIPGRSYAGAWVSWRYGMSGAGDSPYVGWAPLPPTKVWRGGVAESLGSVPRSPYAFVAARNLFADSLRSQVIVGPRGASVAAQSRPWVPQSRRIAAARAGPIGRGGPPPAALGITSSSVVHIRDEDRGVLQARAFARPSTAVALGGRAPEGDSVRGLWAAKSRHASTTTLGRSAPSADADPGQSHFGGRLGVGFTGNPAAETPIRGPSNRSRPGPYLGAAGSSAPAYRAPDASTARPSRGPGGAAGESSSVASTAARGDGSLHSGGGEAPQSGGGSSRGEGGGGGGGRGRGGGRR
jgi:hypothetical protein